MTTLEAKLTAVEQKETKSDLSEIENKSIMNYPKTIAIGTTSLIKKKAVQESIGDCSTIYCLKFPSNVCEQPVGKEETQRGAEYRANQAKELKPECEMWIGIENGMYHKSLETQTNDEIFNNWFDIGCIVLKYKTEHKECKTDVIWTKELAIPVNACRECLNENGTKAKYDGNHTWSPLKDPHSEITNGKKPRKEWLKEAIVSWRKTSIF